MGMRRLFELSIKPENQDIRAAILSQVVDGSHDMKLALSRYDENFEHFTGEFRNWDDNQDDMRKLSKMFPEVLFTLHVNGSSIVDFRNEYFFNGRMQVAEAEVTYEEFDQNQLDNGE